MDEEKCSWCRQFSIKWPIKAKNIPTGMLMFWNLHENIYTRAVKDKRGSRFILMQIREKCVALIEHADGTSSCKLHFMRPPICRERQGLQYSPLLDPESNEELEEIVLPEVPLGPPKGKKAEEIKKGRAARGRLLEYKRSDGRECNRCGDCCYLFAINIPIRGRVPVGMVYFWNLHECVHAQVIQDEKGKRRITIQIKQKCGVMKRYTDGTTSCKLYWMRPPICAVWPTNLDARQSSDLPNCSLFLSPLTEEEIKAIQKNDKQLVKVAIAK